MEETDSKGYRILVIRLGALGDVANTIRAVHAVRRSLSPVHIGWLVEEPSRELVAASRVADEIIVFPRKHLSHCLRRPWRWPRGMADLLRLRRMLRKPGYEVTLDFQGNLKSGWLGLLSGARDRIGFARGHCQELNWLFNNILAMPASRRLPRAEKFSALAQVLAPELHLGRAPLEASAAEAAYVESFISKVSGSGPLVVLHPGTSAFGVFKRWPPERFSEVAADLHSTMDARCVLSCGPGEGPLAEKVATASDGAATIVPLLSMKRLIELLRRADLVISGDTGPLHIAALLERAVVGIYGPKDPAIYAPYGTRSEVVRAEVECSPCTRRKCDHVSCIMEISANQVAAAAKRLLKASSPAG